MVEHNCIINNISAILVKICILLVSYSQFSSIVCEKSENQMTQSCQQILLEGLGLLVLDEGHFPRNKDADILDALSQIHTRRRVLLSGTLFQNNFKELFNLLRLVRPNILDLNSFQALFSWLIRRVDAWFLYRFQLFRFLIKLFLDMLDSWSHVLFLGSSFQSSICSFLSSNLCHIVCLIIDIFTHVLD